MDQKFLDQMCIGELHSIYRRGLDHWSPRDIANWLHTEGGIIGQDAAVKAAALTVYNHYEGRPSISLFMGPTGSGKTEIWRALQREYGPDNIVLHDASTLSAEGWKGSNKISTLFRSMQAGRREQVILVLDEIDKVIAPMYGAHDTNYSDLIQNQLLRLCDHDPLFFGGDDGRMPALSVDCAQVSVVMLGAFERLAQSKAQDAQPLGFGRPKAESACRETPPITLDDLIAFGLRAELAGRIDRIVQLDPLDIPALVQIGQAELERLSQQMGRPVTAMPELLIMLSRVAQRRGLGARWLRARLRDLLDQQIYDSPQADAYHLEYEPADADARRQGACMA